MLKSYISVKRVLVFSSFFLLICILLFFLFIPDWLSFASLENMKKWYPNVGFFMHFFTHTLSYVLLGTGLLVLIVINFKDILTRIKSNKNESFSTGILLMTLGVIGEYVRRIWISQNELDQIMIAEDEQL